MTEELFQFINTYYLKEGIDQGYRQIATHYKGGEYYIVGIAKHADRDKKAMIIYRSFEDGQIYARDSEEFFETMEIEITPQVGGKPLQNKIRRFELTDYRKVDFDKLNQLKKVSKQ